MLPRSILYPLALAGAVVAVYYMPEGIKAGRHTFAHTLKRLRKLSESQEASLRVPTACVTIG
jgi:hypothetical protein